MDPRYPQNERSTRFGGPSFASGFGSTFGYDDIGGQDPLGKKYINRNLREYKSLRKFTTKRGAKRLRKKNTAQLERLAVQAVLQKNKVKRKKLNRKVNYKKYGRASIARARKLLSQGYGRRVLGQHASGEQIKDIPMGMGKKGRRVRRAMQHLTRVRRNRVIMKTPLYAGKGYDIRMGHITGAQARRQQYYRRWR